MPLASARQCRPPAPATVGSRGTLLAATEQTQESPLHAHCPALVLPVRLAGCVLDRQQRPVVPLLGRSRSRSTLPLRRQGVQTSNRTLPVHLISSVSFPTLPTVLSLRPRWATAVIRTPLSFCWPGLDWFQPLRRLLSLSAPAAALRTRRLISKHPGQQAARATWCVRFARRLLHVRLRLPPE